MVKNNHTFEKGETLNGKLQDECYKIIGVTDQSVTYQYVVKGTVLKSEKIPKERARMFIKSGYWKTN